MDEQGGIKKSLQLSEGMKIIFGAEAYNLFNHPNFAVPSNTQSPLTLGGSGEAVFQDAARDLAKNVGRIFTTVGTGRQSKDSTLESKACVKLQKVLGPDCSCFVQLECGWGPVATRLEPTQLHH
jgi:hypothetical protein